MIDSLMRSLPAADAATPLQRVGLAQGDRFVLVTLHRPSSVDDTNLLRRLIGVLSEIARDTPVIFPVHPRTRAQMQAEWNQSPRLLLTEPLSYFEFIGLEARAALVITDSGGVQEETTYLGVPCLTVRDNTERPVTVTTGTNRLIGRDPDALLVAAREELEKPRATMRKPELWDGHAGQRAAAAIVKFLS
jgi:UDP-N-acetylglucosamine 2-epimerase (non-hydrolysing)